MAPPSLDTLPTELLLHIANSLDGHSRNESLRSLALTARCFREVAREVLMCAPRFQLRLIHLFLWEMGHHAEFVNQIKRLEITSDRKGGREKQRDESVSWIRWRDVLVCPTVNGGQAFQSRSELKDKCREIITHHADSKSNTKDWTNALDNDVVPALVGVLIVILPNLKELHVGASWLMDFPLFSQMTSVKNQRIFPNDWSSKHVYLNVVLKKLQSQLTILDFPSDVSSVWFMARPCSLFDFRGFQGLKELNISMRILFWTIWAPFRGPADPGTILPPSLETLRISECTETTANLANELCIHVKKGNFSALHRVELYFKNCLRQIEVNAEVWQCPHPVNDIRKMFKDAELELYLYFPGVKWKTSKMGTTPWSCRDEGRLLEVEIMALQLQGSPCLCKPLELQLDSQGDVVMGGSK